MGNSLRDELLKVGLVSEERLEKPRRARRGKQRPANKRERTPAQAAEDQSNAAARHVLRENQRRTARFVRDSSLGGGSVAESAKRALRRKIQELLQGERRNHDEAEIPYNFIKGKRIKRVYVTEAQRGELTDGKLVIAALDGNHHLLTPEAARQLFALAPQTVICNGAEGEPGTVDADGDEHPVPDDITW